MLVPTTRPTPPLDFGRATARILCLVFGLLGALPLGAGLFARSNFAEAWLSQETSRLLHETFDVTATYAVALNLWPLQVSIEHLTVRAEDGPAPALEVERIAITPRVFSLLAGRLDIGDIEIRNPKARLVFENGRLSNVHLRLPVAPSETPTAESVTSPFHTLSISNLGLNLSVDGIQLDTSSVDLDVFSEGGLAFETILAAGETHLQYPVGFFVHGHTYDVELPAFGPQQLSQWEEDRICRLAIRARLSPDELLLRSVSVQGVVDTDVLPGSQVFCANYAQLGLESVDINAHQLRISGLHGKQPTFQGSLQARLPLNLLNRVTDVAGPFDGWGSVDGVASFDGSTRLPEFSGKVAVGEFKIDDFRVVDGAFGEAALQKDTIHVPLLHMRHGGGLVDATDVSIGLFEPGIPLHAKRADIANVSVPQIIRNLKITPNTIIDWHIKEGHVTDFKGTLQPPRLAGDMFVDTTDFEIFDRSYRSSARAHIFGVIPNAKLDGRFGVNVGGVEFNDVKARFGQSQFSTTVHIGFNDTLSVDFSDSQLHLEEMSPLVTLPLGGVATLQAKVRGPLASPLLTGNVQIKEFNFAGFPLGDFTAPTLRFRPVWVEFENAAFSKGHSQFQIPKSKLDFRSDARVAAHAHLSTKQASFRDFLRLWNFDQDPRWKDLSAAFDSEADLDFALGGPRDPCDGGALHVSATTVANNLKLFGQNYDDASADLTLHWDDIAASYHGMSADLTNVRLTKGSGSIFGSTHVRPGAKLLGNFVATSLPFKELQGFGAVSRLASGTVSAKAKVSGSFDELATEAAVHLSPTIVGISQYPASDLSVRLIPSKAPVQTAGVSGCGRPIPAATTVEALALDRAAGVFHIDGSLFGKQIVLDDFQITRQDAKTGKGHVTFNELELGPFLELNPALAVEGKAPTGKLSGKMNIVTWPFDAPAASEGDFSVSSLRVGVNGYQLNLLADSPFHLGSGRATIPPTQLTLATPLGPKANLAIQAEFSGLGSAPAANASINIPELNLAEWKAISPNIENLAGTLSGSVQLQGRLDRPRYTGGIHLRDGYLALTSSELALSNANADITLQNDRIRLDKAVANVGGGVVTARGQGSLRGLSLANVDAQISASSISYPMTSDIRTTFSAELDAIWAAATEDDPGTPLPKLTGKVDVNSFVYEHPFTVNADITTLTRRGSRTEVESYDPNADLAEFDIWVTSSNAFTLKNNLVDTALRLDPRGLQLTGTTQRFGLRGRLELARGGHINFRRTEFEIQSGEVLFDDSTTISPRVDIIAVTDFRRYTAPSGVVGSSAATSQASGHWRITMHAFGDADNLKLDLTSEPVLPQDDLFLLLTIGLTRTELDRAQADGAGSSVALEALGSITGADSVVSNGAPLVDIHFGSAYSTQTGKTEPTVTIGKRLGDRLRAYVTSRIGESRDLRTNVEWTLSPRLSVQGSYDNINDSSSQARIGSLGNLGADVRWRLEFE